jgi:ABC-type nitrate/sulfonate/bicarbonate transport system substrate-binding protein
VTWTEFSYGPPLLEALRLGNLDVGTVGDTPPIFAQAAGADLVYVAAAPSGSSGSAILLPPGSTLQTLGDLKDKRVAFAHGSAAHNLTVAALEKAGLKFTDIQPIQLAPAGRRLCARQCRCVDDLGSLLRHCRSAAWRADFGEIAGPCPAALILPIRSSYVNQRAGDSGRD